ncbi:ASCH domain-containing protein [Listeria booriae]|uniref:ASCH domain-containing protein n=1 Tax=Listeria booriae TaxID=1552123 RepID=A0A7X1D6U9_9LIST|nr:ASCH domain-containing protein [Listeria booriae]MBC1227410.1 ASCH domain-containing protein [Listeria booriae]MBC1232090.1 ASCH domain-containing protein [Listeria booriae]MBC1234063.1 ASCH domain-containing protein [Listeria booriae]MBC1246311.1 ASCH domain-containing protein [Listeria booriae]MBC1273120.1 ASCH domain-containing protein [Listeria booriae]
MTSETVKNFWQTYARKNNLPLEPIPPAWMFGDGTEEMGDRLGNLVVKGLKTGTCAAHCIHEIENEPIPKVNDYEIVLDGRNEPLVIIKYTKVELVKMNEVTEAFAKSEGEGDLSYDYWYSAHERFFTWELGQYGRTFTPDLLLVCQTIEAVETYSPML